MRYTDLDFRQGDDGLFDFVIDENTRDFAVIDGLEAAFLVSLFSDRRAAPDEVQDPMKRRGWIGNLVSEVPGDNHGSGLWLYEQHRMTPDTAIGVRTEAVQSIEWMDEQQLISAPTAEVIANPVNRTIYLGVTVQEPSGEATQRAYKLADATRNGILVRL